uniref:Uncharacterized protein n=1 Tax=Candidatus Kentrum sp. MB TaxID=2138164 RepID=A0A450XIV8_9GAMM|nr:MAG: hypothetical protein BECKMB1821G_GA0114241_104630 [Candidatus Kentron sp. MB]
MWGISHVDNAPPVVDKAEGRIRVFGKCGLRPYLPLYDPLCTFMAMIYFFQPPDDNMDTLVHKRGLHKP